MGKKNKRRGHPKPHYKGKPLWQLLEKLPNHGIGRLIIRGSFRQDEEHPSYMRILTVDMASKTIKNPNKPNKIKIPVTVERVWRGVIFPRPVNVLSTSYLSDFILIPEAEEGKFLRNSKTASECNYVYWTASQKSRIREMIAEGMSPAEAKQQEKDRIAREKAEVQGSTSKMSQQCETSNQTQSNFQDNCDEDSDDDKTCEIFDSENVPEVQIQTDSPASKETVNGPSCL